ncbi:MAG: sigma-E factor regulatory protein RseB domain-containing protein [Elusimicrobiota bacterium]
MPLLLAIPLLGAGHRPAPEPVELLRRVAAGPTRGYEGHMTVIRWYGGKTSADDARVFFHPPNRYRWEFLAPDGKIERLVVSDGEKESIHLIGQNRVLEGSALKSAPKPQGTDWNLELLLKNYRIESLGEGRSAGRSAWGLDIVSKDPRKPGQRMWIDQETYAVLESRLYRGKGRFTVLSRLSRFEPRSDPDDSLFSFQAPAGASVEEHSLDPDYFSLEELRKATGQRFDFPQELAGGFVFESADLFEVDKNSVRQARYTDGLAEISLFQTDRRIRVPREAASLLPRPGDLGLTGAGRFLRFKRGRIHYALIGDVSKELLSQIAARL